MRTIRTTGTALVAALLLAGLGACGSSTGASGSGGSVAPVAGATTVNLAFQSDMQVPDPDIFYEGEGLVVMTSAYEGLVRYKERSVEVEPALAERYEVSPDGLTYTFTLRPNVTFHDGTPMDAAAVQASFERRTAVDSAPAYMLADVAGYATPDPLTFVITLAHPVSPFIDYLAAAWGPKVLSPTILQQEGGDDFAQTYLSTHDAGTGPYVLSELALGSHYTLTRYDGYWGPKPAIEQINIAILPDMTTQRLQLEGGQIQMIIKGLTRDDITSLGGKDGLQVVSGPSMFKSMIFVDENDGIFADQDLRTALSHALDRQKLTDAVYGSTATVSKQLYPIGQLPEDLAVDEPTLDPGELQALVASLPDKTVDIAYTSDDSRNQQMADQVQAQLGALGLQVTSRAMPLAIVFDLANQPDQVPDLLISTQPPDGAHPDTWVRPFMSTGAPINFLQCSVPEADAAMDEGLVQTDRAKMQAAYGKAGDLLVAEACFLPIADVQATIVASAGYENFVLTPAVPYTVRFGALRPTGT